MSITITAVFSTPEEALNFLAGRTTATTNVVVAEKPRAEAKEVKADKPGKSASQPEAPAPTPPTAEAVPAAAPADKPKTYEQSGIADRITALVKKDRNAAVALLAKFGVKRGPELKPEDWPAVIAALDEALAPALA